MKTLRVALPLVLVSTMSASPAVAQLFSVGVKAGINRADVSVASGGTDLETAGRTSFHGAGVISLGFNERFSVQLEGHVVGKGFEPGDAASGVTANLDMTYLDFPVVGVLTIPLGEDGILAPRLFAGPVIGLSISCNLSVSAGDQTGLTNCDQDVRNADFGIVLGGGLKIGRGAGGLTLDVAYNHGLSNINSSGAVDHLRNRNLMLSVGVLVPII